MSCWRGILLGILFLVPAMLVRAQTTAQDWQARLSSQHYLEREKASRALEKLGPAAIPILDKIIQGTNLDVKRRAMLLRDRIEERVLIEKLLRPTSAPPKESLLKSDYASDDRHSVRVRVKWLSMQTFEGKGPCAKFVVELAAEPWLSIVPLPKVAITKLVDDSGKVLSDVQPIESSSAIQPGGLLFFQTLPWSDPPCKLKELHGQVSLQFKTQRPMGEVKRILQANGKEMQGKHGITLKVLQASRTDEGDYQLRLYLDHLENLTPALPEEQIVRVRPGFVAIRGPVDIALHRLHLIGARGQRYAKLKAEHQQSAGKSGYVADLLFEGKGTETEEPALVMMDAPCVVPVQMPFVVHSVSPPQK